jgi:hypothetical protein
MEAVGGPVEELRRADNPLTDSESESARGGGGGSGRAAAVAAAAAGSSATLSKRSVVVVYLFLLRTLRRNVYYVYRSWQYTWLANGAALGIMCLCFQRAPSMLNGQALNAMTNGEILGWQQSLVALVAFDTAAMLWLTGVRQRDLAHSVFHSRVSLAALLRVATAACLLLAVLYEARALAREDDAALGSWLGGGGGVGGGGGAGSSSSAAAAAAAAAAVEHGGSAGTPGTGATPHSMSYAAVLPALFIVCRSRPISAAVKNLAMTLLLAREVLLLAATFLAVVGVLGLTLMKHRYDSSLPGRNFGDVKSSMLTMFIFLFTGENWPAIVHDSGRVRGSTSDMEGRWIRLYYILFSMMGALGIVSLIIATFQQSFQERYDRLLRQTRDEQRLAIVVAFVVLDEMSRHRHAHSIAHGHSGGGHGGHGGGDGDHGNGRHGDGLLTRAEWSAFLRHCDTPPGVQEQVAQSMLLAYERLLLITGTRAGARAAAQQRGAERGGVGGDGGGGGSGGGGGGEAKAAEAAPAAAAAAAPSHHHINPIHNPLDFANTLLHHSSKGGHHGHGHGHSHGSRGNHGHRHGHLSALKAHTAEAERISREYTAHDGIPDDDDGRMDILAFMCMLETTVDASQWRSDGGIGAALDECLLAPLRRAACALVPARVAHRRHVLRRWCRRVVAWRHFEDATLVSLLCLMWSLCLVGSPAVGGATSGEAYRRMAVAAAAQAAATSSRAAALVSANATAASSSSSSSSSSSYASSLLGVFFSPPPPPPPVRPPRQMAALPAARPPRRPPPPPRR